MGRQHVLRSIVAVTLAILFLVMAGRIVSTAASEALVAMTAPQTLPIPENGAYIGAYIGDLLPGYPDSLSQIEAFECMTGRRLAIVNRFWSMKYEGRYADFDWLNLNEHFADGRIFMISWDPKDSTSGNPIRYQDIISGTLDDTLIISAAQDAAEFGEPLFIRWSWEMDGQWNPSGGPNAFGPDGTQSYTQADDLNIYFGSPTEADGPERFVAAWHHIHTIFDAAGADNVIWVWSPNWSSRPKAEDEPWNNLAAYYPGDDQVDWIGTSLYAREDNGNVWLSFSEMFNHSSPGPSIAEFHKLHPDKPVMIAEIGASEKLNDPDAKAHWITTTYGTEVKEFPYIKALLWFSMIAEGIDWRVNSSQASLNAYRIAISDPYYLAQIQACAWLPQINKP